MERSGLRTPQPGKEMDIHMVTDSPNLRTLIEWIDSLQIKPTRKLLMRKLADYHGNDGNCWPSANTLARQLCVTRRTIMRILKELEELGVIIRRARYRPNDGGRTSNLYRFCLPASVPGDGTTVSHQEKPLNKILHAGKQNVISAKGNDGASASPVIEATDQQSSPRNTPTRKQATRAPRKPYRIEADSMRKPETAQHHYNNFVRQKWIGPSERDLVAFYGCWAKSVRKYLAGEIENPGGNLMAIIKRGLLHKYPTDQDEEKGRKCWKSLHRDPVTSERLMPDESLTRGLVPV